MGAQIFGTAALHFVGKKEKIGGGVSKSNLSRSGEGVLHVVKIRRERRERGLKYSTFIGGKEWGKRKVKINSWRKEVRHLGVRTGIGGWNKERPRGEGGEQVAKSLGSRVVGRQDEKVLLTGDTPPKGVTG